ncbi:MAG TPA: UDP-N-acetylmuramoyl-L-alanyl-D-glutamate--2,6-diaminopimelate ligase, partial [Usitatibacter sp.]|nr:UDP-N-acetylmuramoyl-L-alanyl-D-glutamate--2,6-diaminopimelate ligase [Usitatibacter sp.]
MIARAGIHRNGGAALLDRLAQLGVPLADLTADSRTVKMGSIFVAYPGTAQDGRAFIADSIARGAAAVIWERQDFEWDERWEVPNLGVEGLRLRISEIAGHVYGNPSETLWMAGVTGTNGKTSVSQWIAAALDAMGRRSAVLGTLGNGLVGERAEAKNTTPDPIVLQRLLAEYLRRGARNVAMEVSSHGLDQGRVAGVRFDTAVFTNLTRDHLDYHGTMESYAEAKARLFSSEGLTNRVVNIDDEWGASLAARFGPDVITYGTSKDARLRASRIGLSEAGVRFHLDSEWGDG